MPLDKYEGFESLTSQSERWQVVVPDDVNNLPVVPKALFFNSAGNVVLEGDDGNAVTFTVVAQQTLDVRPTKVRATGTTVAAGGIVALL